MTHHPKPDPAKEKVLANCPFCSSRATLRPNNLLKMEYYQVICSRCLAETGCYGSPTAAIAAWNHRAPSPSPAPPAATPETEAIALEKVTFRYLPAVDLAYGTEDGWDGKAAGDYYRSSDVDAILAEKDAKVMALEKRLLSAPEICPCKIADTPCDPDCTCVEPFMSRGCNCCASYGSDEQRKAMANFLVSLSSRLAEARREALEECEAAVIKILHDWFDGLNKNALTITQVAGGVGVIQRQVAAAIRNLSDGGEGEGDGEA